MSRTLDIKYICEKFKVLYDNKGLRHLVFYGGRGGMKSFHIADAIIYYTIKFEINVLCIRSIQNSIDDSVYSLLKDRAEHWGVDDQFQFLKGKIRGLNGSQILFYGTRQDPKKIKSANNISIMWYEEAETATAEELKDIPPTIRGQGSICIWSLNPELPSAPIAKKFLLGPVPDSTKVIKVTYKDNPVLPEVLRMEMEDLKENNYELYRHVWLGEFRDESDNKLIPYSLVKESIERTPIYEESPIVAGLDVARFGDDRSVLFIRKGNEIITYFQWKGKGAVELCQLVSNEILNHGINVLVVDCVGVGGGTFDLLKDTVNTCRLVEFNGAFSAENSIYKNARIETYERLKEWLKVGRLPKDDDLINELITLEYDFAPNQQKFLESKEGLKKRLGKSPDLADALSMTFFVKKAGGKKNLKKFKRGSAWT